jgi:hypothetical protein
MVIAAFYTFDAASGKLISEKIEASVLEQMQGRQRSVTVA